MDTAPITPDTADTATSKPIDLDYLRHEFNRFREELSTIKSKLGVQASETVGQFNEYLHSDDAATRLKALEKQLEELGGKLKDNSKEAAAQLEAKVVERPLASVAIAFGVGLLVSQLLRRN
ncbi:MAG: hypothetical protein B7X08_03285 [Acidocella sp. 20-63-7]|nr:MAG: hypothetical protein B7X08_03285 [Acidocella sp. 20-63-7]HQT45755.1 hypothetical protein [Acidocella sp.]